MSQKHRYLLAILIAGLLFALSFAFWRSQGTQSQTVVKDMAQVERQDLESVVAASGVLNAATTVDVAARTSGVVKRLLVDVGDKVSEGDLLAEIDTTILKESLKNSEWELASSVLQIDERKQALGAAQLKYDRQKNLYAAEATTLEALQEAELALKSAINQIKIGDAQLKQSAARLALEKAKVANAIIYAPISGAVSVVKVRQGESVVSDFQVPVILQLVNMDEMTVEASVVQGDIGLIKIGMTARFNLPDQPDKQWQGTVTQIDPTPESSMGVTRYKVRFKVANPEKLLMQKMSVQVFFVTGSASDVLTVPIAALFDVVPLPEGPGFSANVRTLNAKRQEEIKAVKVGLRTLLLAEIKEGLAEGDTVLLGQ